MKEITYQWILLFAIVTILILSWHLIVLKRKVKQLKNNHPGNYYQF